MLSLLCPTRKRLVGAATMFHTAVGNAANPIEVVFYQDEDDDTVLPVLSNVVRGPRIVLSDCWNKCAEVATGDILMMASDDMAFRTPGWDLQIEQAFAECPDKILMVHGNDLRPWGNCENFGVFPTIHRRWYSAVGYFVPGILVGNCADNWFNDIADALGRRRYLPYITEHLHVYCGKAPMDSTYQDRIDRELADDPQKRYETLKPERDRVIGVLRSLLGTPA